MGVGGVLYTDSSGAYAAITAAWETGDIKTINTERFEIKRPAAE